MNHRTCRVCLLVTLAMQAPLLAIMPGAKCSLSVCCRTVQSLSHARPATKQALAAELKAEVRAALGKHGVARFVIKPVRRSYAFERPGVPHGQQWVLKVRYPASSPALPLELTGAACAHSKPYPCSPAGCGGLQS